MNRKIYLLFLLCTGQQLMAQLPEDALRMSWNAPSGTARNQAIGGAMGSLGGEITSVFVNPAGLGLYKTGEIVLSPGWQFGVGKGSFLETNGKGDRFNRFAMGTSGIIWGYSDPYSKWTSKAFSIAINRTANFNANTYYKGTNDYSSFTEPLANEFFDYYVQQKNANPSLSDDVIIDNALNDPSLSLMSKMALYTYLTDVDTTNGQTRIVSRPEEVGLVTQENKINTRGGITELALGFATNMDDKLYIGGSIGVPIVNYERNSEYTESDATGNPDNNFNYFTYKEKYTSKGMGINAKLGVIFKPATFIRIGMAVHSPTLYGLKDKSSSEMSTDMENLLGPGSTFNVDSKTFNSGTDPEFKYDLVSPWKFILSGSYVIREVEDVTRQKGFITADVEYVTYGSSRFSAADQYSDDSYYKGVNTAVRSIYKGAFNFRVGGELKFNTIMARAGFAWYGKPYDDKELKAHKMNISGGLGYRNKGMFLDLTYVQSLNKDVNFPYRVDPPRLNVFADVNNNSGTVLLTAGFKF